MLASWIKIPDVQKETTRTAICWAVLLPCMKAAGLIGIAQGFLLGLTVKNESTLAGVLLSGFSMALYGVLVGAVVGGLWGFLVYSLFFRKTLSSEIFQTVAAISFTTGVASLLYFHFIKKDGEPVSVFLIPLGTLFAAVALRIRLVARRSGHPTSP